MAHFCPVQYADYYTHILVHLLLINILVSATNPYFLNDTVPLKACAKVLRNGRWLPGVISCAVWYPGEIDSGQYYIARRFLQKIHWLWAALYPKEFLKKKSKNSAKYSITQNCKYFKLLVNGSGRFQCWKNGVENLVDCPFKLATV